MIRTGIWDLFSNKKVRHLDENSVEPVSFTLAQVYRCGPFYLIQASGLLHKGGGVLFSLRGRRVYYLCSLIIFILYHSESHLAVFVNVRPLHYFSRGVLIWDINEIGLSLSKHDIWLSTMIHTHTHIYIYYPQLHVSIFIYLLRYKMFSIAKSIT